MKFVALLATTAVVGLVSAVAPASADPVTFERKLNADNEPQNWLMTHQNYSNHRYSGLDAINQDNVGQLVPAFSVFLGGWATVPNGFKPDRYRSNGAPPKEEEIPLVADGFLYTEDGLSKTMKIDVRDGHRGTMVWRFSPDPAVTSYRNRKGVALLNDNVYIATGDVRAVAVNATSGEQVFDTNLWAPVQPGSAATSHDKQMLSAPPVAIRTAAGRNIMEVGESGTLGYGNHWMAAVDADTGEFLWRFWSIPAPGEPGHETWKNDAWMTGGAGFWGTPSYDPVTNVFITGTGDSFPSYDPEYRPGDNLYAVSMVIVDADSGQLKSYFQPVPSERWDLDDTNNKMIYTAQDGTRVISDFARSGFWYNHDLDKSVAEGGRAAFIRAVQYVRQVTWTDGIDPKTGYPIEYDPAKDVQTYKQFANGGLPRANMGMANASLYCPTWDNQNISMEPSTFDRDRREMYATTNDGCVMGNVVTEFRDGNNAAQFIGQNGCCWTGETINHGFSIVGINVDNQEKRYVMHTDDHNTNESGLLGTAGGLLFTAWQNGDVVAYSKDTGAALWTYSTGTNISAPVITYAVDGKQYIAVQAGSDSGAINGLPDGGALGGAPILFVFALPG